MKKKIDKLPDNFIKFFGTSGARIVQAKQYRSSGGIWVRLNGTNLIIDPGPGTLIRTWGNKPPLDPSTLDGILLSHRHLDHSNDLNVMVESMVEGGLSPKGKVFAPSDALDGNEPILFHYIRKYLDEVVKLEENTSYKLKNIVFSTPIKHQHPVETYGFRVKGDGIIISFITDTRYFDSLAEYYKGDIVVLNTTFVEPIFTKRAYHLSIKEIPDLLVKIKPKVAILNHFGTPVLKAGPDRLAAEITKKIGIKTIAAKDGMLYST